VMQMEKWRTEARLQELKGLPMKERRLTERITLAMLSQLLAPLMAMMVNTVYYDRT
jgi:hypothetical protein